MGGRAGLGSRVAAAHRAALMAGSGGIQDGSGVSGIYLGRWIGVSRSAVPWPWPG